MENPTHFQERTTHIEWNESYYLAFYNKEHNLAGCSCTYEPCDKKGICCECIRYHLRMSQVPACMFPEDAEKTYDRSIEHFIRVYKGR